MEPYQKINGLYKRYPDGPRKGQFVMGDWAIPEFEYLAKNRWEFTEKVDGTNIRVKCRLIGDKVHVMYGGRTDRAVIPEPLLLHLEKTFPTLPSHRRDITQPPYSVRWLELINWMRDAGLEEATLYGEGYGPDIQGGGKYRNDVSFVLFDVRVGSWWLKRTDVNDVAEKLGIDAVPVLGYGTIQDAIDIVSSGLTWDSNGKMTNWGGVDSFNKRTIGGLKSTWGNFQAEGIVAVPAVPLFDRKGDRIITKIKSVDFKPKDKK